jgi:hypothetical protein
MPIFIPGDEVAHIMDANLKIAHPKARISELFSLARV